MSKQSNGIGVSDDASIRSLSELPDDEASIRFSIDLVGAARRHLSFLSIVAESPWLHHSNTTLFSIRRYEELWMPFIADLTVGSTKPQMLLPPLDIQWVWHCHSLNPAKYRQYCESRFSKLVGFPIILDDENEDYALNRCRDLWILRYPSEPFELEAETTTDIEDSLANSVTNEDIFSQVSKNRSLYSKFSEPYMFEIVYLIAARQRYKGLLYLLQRLGDGLYRGSSNSLIVPTSDILLMWLTHQSYPLEYAGDMKEMEGNLEKVIGVWDSVNEKDMKATKELWERTFGQPYEKAGATLDRTLSTKSLVYWEISNYDINKKYKSMEPRFLLEVCVFVGSKVRVNEMEKVTKQEFLRLCSIKCHKELRIDKPIVDGGSWRRTWHLYCEFGTRGVVIERRRRGGVFFRRTSTLIDKVVFPWNDLLRAPSLTLANEMEQQTEQLCLTVVASITPPVQAPYLLKCVPDRVTDDSGAMISDVILRMNSYHPQEGRWLSRTVLDHAGRECFVIRIRMAGGFWRRGGETPTAVKRQDRIIEIREGSWKYIAGSIGTAPDKVVGTATPVEEESGARKASWYLSTGDELTIQWDSSSSSLDLSFRLENNNPLEPSEKVRLLRGRKMQYRVSKRNQVHVQNKDQEEDGVHESGGEEEEEEEEEEGFVTVVRFTPDNPNGRATALLNWKLLVVELLPEEDAVLVLLLCMTILWSVSEMTREDIGGLLIRRRLKEAKLGTRDWGSVMLHPWCTSSPSLHSPYLLPWYWNARAVMASADEDPASRFNYSPAEGGDKLYKREILF
ncbi:uncharacterized protein LOC122092680 [Macadamia integrifolia]|uniref:uncharacterized protein LOC122092680 n=1 Tax=Macadamia integrifolia TaxID=60698 RepID=UPI001C53306C|nr:uncharacterized protein LOC122092680 [Macadamia integrifolia]